MPYCRAMSGFTKLFNSILASTIWREDSSTRLVWITMLAMADRRGVVEASVPGLADFARVPVQECRAALERLAAPDPDSRSQTREGRRIETIQGGWLLINFAEYRNKLSADERREYNRIKKAESRQKPDDDEMSNNFADMSNNVNNVSNVSTQQSTEATTEVRTVLEDQVRTVSNTVVSRGKNSHDDNGFQLRIGERRQGNGANEPNSLPRDHVKHRICGGPLSKLCFSYNQYDSLATRYRGTTPEQTDKALREFHTHVLTQIPEDKLAGDMVWLLKHFDAWLVTIGRVAVVPSKKKPKQEIDLVAMEKEINEEKAAKALRARERRR